MQVLDLPVLPVAYFPVCRTPSEAGDHFKTFDAGRVRFVSRWRGALHRVLADEWKDVAVATSARALSPGHAQVLAEQAMGAHRQAIEDAVYALYADVAKDYAARTSRGLKWQLSSERKASPIEDLGFEDLRGKWVRVVADWMAKNAGRRVANIQAGTLAQVRTVLEAGVREGLSMPRIAARMRESAPEIVGPRALVIARTEVIAASNLGSRAGAIDTGLRLSHAWLATPGPRTRPAHASANGQQRPLDEHFVVWGEKLLFPGDTSFGASAKNVIHCRCTVTFDELSEAVEPGAFDEHNLKVDTLKHYRKDGRWTDERQRLHDQIVADAIEGVEASEDPIVHMMGGGSASGKSTMLGSGHVSVPSRRAAVYVDPDAIKDRLPEYGSMTKRGSVQAAAQVHEESSHISKRIIAEATARRQNIVLDGVAGGPVEKLAEKVGKMRAYGHRIVANYATNDVELALRLSNARGLKTNRFVPESVVRELHQSVSDVFPKAVGGGVFDEVTLVDTNIKDTPRLVATMKGGTFTVHNDELWRMFLAKATPAN